MPTTPIAPPPGGDEVPTGIRRTTLSVLQALVTQVTELREEVAELRGATWTLILREQFDRPVWPGKVELRLGTLVVLLVVLVVLFGSDRVAGWLPSWLAPAGVAP